MISRVKRLYEQPDPRGHLIASIGSAYGHRRGRAVLKRNLAAIREAHAWLKGKRILILGTGPSVAGLTKELVAGYGFVVLLNHAIKFIPTLSAFVHSRDSIGFYCCDRGRIIEVAPKLKTLDLPKNRCIFIPDYPYSVCFMDIHRFPVKLLAGFKEYRRSYVHPSLHEKGGWHFLYTDTPINSERLKRAFLDFMDGTSSAPALPPYSAVFSAILFYSLFRPERFDLVGCDFTNAFSVEPMAETFSLVQSMLSNYGIGLTNRSSELLSDDGLPGA